MIAREVVAAYPISLTISAVATMIRARCEVSTCERVRLWRWRGSGVRSSVEVSLNTSAMSAPSIS